MSPGWLRVVAISALALLGSLAVYGKTASYGFSYDDYHFVRPFSSAEVFGAWHGSWDASGIEARFYRPLTTAFMALRFEVFGINATAYRWLTLGMFAAAAALCGVWVAAFLLTVPFASVAAHAVSDFAPCSAGTLYSNAIVRGWAIVPAEIRVALPVAAASCDARFANPADLPIVVFGAWDTEYENGVAVRWTTGRVTILARPASASLLLPFHAMLGPRTGTATRVLGRTGGYQVLDMVLRDGGWRCPRIPLDARAVSGLRRSVFVELEISPTWIPAVVFPGSLDRRELGMRLGPMGTSCPG
jgi:hypothetical protein